MKKHIAIDGPAGAGKSTVARKLAERLSYLYVDTGAMYRAITYYLLMDEIDYNDTNSLEKALESIDLRFEVIDGASVILLNGIQLNDEIRQPIINEHVSPVAKIAEVRHFLRKKQWELALSTSSVTEGRDIGTVVLPEADLKIFLTARPEIRARRRWEELASKGMGIDYQVVLKNVLERDAIDSNRAEAPLRQADDAILVDTSEMTIDEVVNFLYRKVIEDE